MPLRSFCIHAHFYQPPREDPLTGIIPKEAGSAPFPNWNERIHAECYRPNAEHGNFSVISFNIGPTLCNWMAGHDPKTWGEIIAQDHANLERNGVGNAIAQAYNHTILPLASHQDKVTQIAWGIADFEHRFGRKPQGMWLPETAVDYDVLRILAERGIEFTILAPWQADRENLDVTHPYRVHLPGGNSIVVFFYHRDLSGGISFNPAMTVNADHFARYDLLNQFPALNGRTDEPQIILIATDGELYGHHQPHRDLFLAHLMNGSIRSLDVQPTYPALWLKENPVRHTVGIREATSWSCHHGVSRWLGTCDCTPGDAQWKAHLRYAFTRLSQALDDLYLQTVRSDIPDPWEMRHRYIQVMLGSMSIEELVSEMAGRRVSPERLVQIHLLLEAQRERQRMYTSCGWFFEDFDRIEPKNNLAYAAQAVRLTRLATGVDLEPYVLKDLSKVISPRTWLRADIVFNYYMKRAIFDGRIVAGD